MLEPGERAEVVEPPAQSGLEIPGLGEAVSRVRRFIGGDRKGQTQLVSALSEVAAASTSAMYVGEVLEVIVDRVRRTTESDKVVVVLLDDHDPTLDLETLTVRGMRAQHDEAWWGARLEELSHRLWQDAAPVLEEHPDRNGRLLCVPIMVRQRPLGLLACINGFDQPFNQDQIDFVSVVAAFAASAIEGARYAEQSRYVLVASERDRIAREMHDGVVQSLFSISLGMEVCKKQLEHDPAVAAERLGELQSHLNVTMGELRRFIYDLRPLQLKELGLVGASRYWVREVTLGRETQGVVTVQGDFPLLKPAEEALLYRVMKEAVSNVIRHSGAESFEVRFEFEPGVARVSVSDDGHGFDPDTIGSSESNQMGLQSIQRRVEQENGRLLIDSGDGKGTVVRIDLQLEE